jgi:hypothetical protein
MDAGVALVAVGWGLPWGDPVFLALFALLAWRGQGLPVIALLACVAELAPSLLQEVCAWGALLLLAMHSQWWAAVLAAVLSGPSTCLYLLWLWVMPDRSWGERHVLAVVLSLALGCPEAFRVVAPVAALLVFGKALERRWLGGSVSRFVLGLGVAVAATVALCGGVGVMAAWLLQKVRILWRQALAQLGVLAIGALLIAGGRLRASQASQAADRKVFHIAIVAIAALPFLVSRRAERVNESLALGGMLGVCALLLVELFRLHSGKNLVAWRLNTWFEPWIDEKDRGQPVATTHLYLVLGSLCPDALCATESDIVCAICGSRCRGSGRRGGGRSGHSFRHPSVGSQEQSHARRKCGNVCKCVALSGAARGWRAGANAGGYCRDTGRSVD